jgi:hypothetical protein
MTNVSASTQARPACLVKTHKARPRRWPTLDNFALVETRIPELADGQGLVRNVFISVPLAAAAAAPAHEKRLEVVYGAASRACMALRSCGARRACISAAVGLAPRRKCARLRRWGPARACAFGARAHRRRTPNGLYRASVCERCGGKILARSPEQPGGESAVEPPRWPRRTTTPFHAKISSASRAILLRQPILTPAGDLSGSTLTPS